MKIGYPCVNDRIDCSTSSTFRLKNYSEKNLESKIGHNLDCLRKILKFNVSKEILFFRISSDIIPFASHKICRFNWQNYFQKELREIGDIVKDNDVRITMHPDQFIVLNSNKKGVVKRSVKELHYHCDLLDKMGLDSSAKIILHVGGVYGDKKKAKERFIENYGKLSKKIKKRLVIENDDRSYSLKDCREISEKIQIPVVFDVLHHQCLNNGESIEEGINQARETWQKRDGKAILHYSSQQKGKRNGKHSKNIDINHFKDFVKKTKGLDFDLMLEIKDKEKSVFKANEVLTKIFR